MNLGCRVTISCPSETGSELRSPWSLPSPPRRVLRTTCRHMGLGTWTLLDRCPDEGFPRRGSSPRRHDKRTTKSSVVGVWKSRMVHDSQKRQRRTCTCHREVSVVTKCTVRYLRVCPILRSRFRTSTGNRSPETPRPGVSPFSTSAPHPVPRVYVYRTLRSLPY